MTPSPTPTKQKQFLVKVYRPNRWYLCSYEFNSKNEEGAIARTKAALYREGRLSHFYHYEVIDRKKQSRQVALF